MNRKEVKALRRSLSGSNLKGDLRVETDSFEVKINDDNEKENILLTRQLQIAEHIRKLNEELTIARNDGKLAAEIGQHLVIQDQEKSRLLANAKEAIKVLESQGSGLERLVEKLQLDVASTKDFLDEATMEATGLRDRNNALTAKVENTTRECLDSSRKIHELEFALSDATRNVEALEIKNKRLELVATTVLASVKRENVSVDANHNVLMKDTPEYVVAAVNEDVSRDFKTPLRHKQSNRLYEELESVRNESSKSKQKIQHLEKELRTRSLESQQSSRKLLHLESSLEEYQELLKDQGEKVRSYKEMMNQQVSEHELPWSVQVTEDTVTRLQEEIDAAKVQAMMREHDIERMCEDLQSARDMLSFEGRAITFRKRDRRESVVVCDTGVDTCDLEISTPVEETRLLGHLTVKKTPSTLFGVGRGAKWKTRSVELRGSELFFFRNEWDKNPGFVLPLDGTEVRVLRRPHYQDTENSKKANKHSDATRRRAGRILHEFHIWHAGRKLVRLSAPTHVEMSQWARSIQTETTNCSVQPKQFAAGYLSMNNVGKQSTRYFAVLRSDGIHLYLHPADSKAQRVVIVDDSVRIWYPTASEKVQQMLPDIKQTLCITTNEQGTTQLVADTDIDREWWSETVRAHTLGIVSWGGIFGIRDETPFGCIDV